MAFEAPAADGETKLTVAADYSRRGQ